MSKYESYNKETKPKELRSKYNEIFIQYNLNICPKKIKDLPKKFCEYLCFINVFLKSTF